MFSARKSGVQKEKAARTKRGGVVGAVVLLFAVSCAWADGAQSVVGARVLVEAATQCTASTIRAYALATCETSEAVLAAAIAKCGEQWSTAASAMVDAANADPAFRRDMAESHRNARRLGPERPTSGNNAFDVFVEKQKTIDTYRATIVGFFRAQHETDAFDARVAGPAIQCGSAPQPPPN